jgi:HD-GYP domain-containing protein (c-di-GMP phosphodiesterase class II)
MTTTRPYRKALDVEEALGRLEQAAGTQLEPGLVEAFVHGLRTVPDAPQPGADAASARLWMPYSKVA